MNILAIGAHPDDIEILCGGTLALYAAMGHNIFMAVATNGNVGTPNLTREEIAAVRREEQARSCAIIGAELIWMGFDDEWLFNDRPTRTVFLDAIRTARPDVMFIHSPNDYLSDHRVAGQVAEDCRIPCSVRLVETNLPHCEKIPHVFYMDNAAGLDFLPEFYADIETVIDKKRAMLSCHKSQEIWMKEAYGEAVSEIMERKSHMRGLAITKKYAEGFRKVRTYPFLNSASLLPGYATPLS
jgi:LmbE family N-acetylglucosaminyl deacetylase